MSKRYVSELELAALAKQFRLKAGKTKIGTAALLGVGRPSVQLAETDLEQSLFKLRKRIVEIYSPFRVTGPFYRLERK
jgi:hypothetical protein